MTRRWIVRLPTALLCAAAGLLAGTLLAQAVDEDPKPPQRVAAKIDAQVLVDATVIEMRGYGSDGTPGKFLYDCDYEGQRLICTQREQPAQEAGR